MMEYQILYKYSKIELEQFAMFEENYSDKEPDMQFETEVQFSFDRDNNILCSKIIVTASQSDNLLFKAVMNSYFEIKDESVRQLTQGKRIVFGPQLLVQFASLCYGTLRGVIHLKTLGTSLNPYILPPVFFDSIIDKPFTAEIIL